MSTASPNARGENRRIYALRKTAYAATFPAFLNSHALRCMEFKMGLKRPRETIQDNRQALGVVERVSRIPEGTWSLEMFLRGSGALGTTWSCSPFLFCAFGTETINAGVDIRYTPSASQSALGWLDLMEEMNQVYSETALNAWVKTWKISGKGKDEPKLSIDGGFSDDIITGSTTLAANAANLATTLVLTSGHDLRFDATSSPQLGSRITVGTSTGPHEITARADAQLTISPGLTGAQNSGDVIRPYHPGEVAPQNVIAGILGNFQIAGETYRILDFEVGGGNNIEPNDDEALLQRVDDYDRGWRDTTGFVKFRARRDQIRWLRQRKDFGNVALNVDIGNVAGRIMEIDIPRAEFDFEALEVPSKGSAIVTLPYVAKASAHDLQDELTVILR